MRNEEIPSSVRAVAVITDVIDVPELVMNAFDPLMTHWPFSNTARVLVAPASLPPSASVKPNAPSARPEMRSGNHVVFCSSFPKR